MAGRGDIQAGSAFVRLFTKDGDLVKGLNAAKQKLVGFGSSVAQAGAVIGGLGTALLAPLSAAVAHFVELGGSLADMSVRTGISANALGELKFAAEQSGATLDDVEKSTRKMQSALADAAGGSTSMRKTFTDLGLSWQALSKLKPDEQLQAIGDALMGVNDVAKRNDLAKELLGKSGTMLLPMLANLREARAEAARLGIAPSDAAVSLADDLGDAIDKSFSVLKATMFEIGAAVAPMLFPALRIVTEITAAVTRWVKDNQAIVQTVAAIGAGLVVAGGIVAAIGGGFILAGLTLGGIAATLTAIGGAVAFLASPLGIALGVMTAIGVGVAAWLRYTESGRETVAGITSAFSELGRIASTALGGITDALMGGKLELAGQIAVKSLQLIFQEALAGISAMIGGILGGAIGKIGTKVIAGDLKGAWDTTVKGMGAVWDTLIAGMVKAFKSAVDSIRSLLQTVTAQMTATANGLAAIIAASGAPGGQQIANTLRGVGAIAGAAGASANAKLGTISSVAGMIDRFTSAKAADSIAKAVADIGDGAGESAKEILKLNGELTALRTAAAAAREATDAKVKDAAKEGTAISDKASISSTFSAAALVAMGNGGGPQERAAKAAEAIVDPIRESRDDLKKIKEKIGLPVFAA